MRETIMELTEYGAVEVAYRSRFLFRTEAEYRKIWGVSFETVMNNRHSKRDVETYYNILNKEVIAASDESLYVLMDNYLATSELFSSLDWGDRTQMASRKKFCRMLFRYYATGGKELTIDEGLKFRYKDDDRRLLQLFFPDGVGKTPRFDISFIVLLTFGVIRPWISENSRGRDISDKDIRISVERLLDLLYVLQDDMPRIGSMDKPHIFIESLDYLNHVIAHREKLADVAPLLLYSTLSQICLTCRGVAVPDETLSLSESIQGIDMPGIWIDDADKGNTRFWIFPHNLLSAFCYCRKGAEWELRPYELLVHFADNPYRLHLFAICDPAGSRRYQLSSDNTMGNNNIVSGWIDMEWADEEGDYINRVILEPYMEETPEWCDWNEWPRLPADDDRYKDCHAVLQAIYNPDNPYSRTFTNMAPELTDMTNNLVGRDNRYIYVYDSKPRKFRISDGKSERFLYRAAGEKNIENISLFELEISEEHPLYAIPKEMSAMNSGKYELNKFAEIMRAADGMESVCILHSDSAKHPRLIFPDFGVKVGLDMDVRAKMGVKRFTQRCSFM